MKRSIYMKKSLALLHATIALGLVLSSCGMLPEDVQKELDAVVKQQEEYLKETAQAKAEQLQVTAQAKGEQLQETAQAKAGEVLGDAGERVKEIPGEVIQSAKEWLGLAAPADVGKVTIAITTKSSRAEIEAAFKKAYQLAGGGRTIGSPDGLVQRQGSELLAQKFSGGSQKRSVIVMQDGLTKAYFITGEWLNSFEGVGGFDEAGYPTSDPESWGVEMWKVWRKGRGQRQLFLSNSGEYALMKAVDSDIVHILPPDVWAFYAVNKKYEKIGYPLSSFPFHDDRWRVDNRISDSTKNLLARWESSKYRAQVFENGGILMNPRPTQFEMIEAKQLVGAGPLRDARFMLDLSGVLLNEYNTRNEYQDSCFISTLHHAAAMSHSSAMSTALGQVPKMIMEAILSGGGLVAESAYVKIGIFAANVTLRKDERTSWTDAIRQVVAGQVVESIYSAGIGEILSKPAAIVTLDKLQSQYDQISDVRYTNAIRTTPGHSYPGLPFETFVTTMDVTLVVAYDPLLNMVSGVMTSQQCAANEGAYAFNFKFDPGKIEGAISGKIAPPDQVWDGQVLFTDLKTGEAIR